MSTIDCSIDTAAYFAGIRAGLKSLVPEFSQHVDAYEPPVAVGGER